MTVLRVELLFSLEAFAELAHDLDGTRRSLEAGLSIGGAEPLLLWAQGTGVVGAIAEGEPDADSLAEAVAGAFVTVTPHEWHSYSLTIPTAEVLLLPSAERSHEIARMALEGEGIRCVCGAYPPPHYSDCKLRLREDERGVSPADSGGSDSGASGISYEQEREVVDAIAEQQEVSAH